MPPPSRSSTRGSRFTTPSTGGAGTPPTRPTPGIRNDREPEVSEALTVSAATPAPAPAAREFPSIQEAFRVWLRVAALSFGGPAGQIAVMHRILVEEKRWVSESRFLHALNYCMLLPGPEAQQLATYIGWLMHKTRGGVMAGGLFVLPGIIAIMALSYVYAAFGNGALGVGAVFGPQ